MDFKSLFTWEIKQLTYAHYDNIQVAFFTPFFYSGLQCREISVTDNVGTKQENSSIFGSKTWVI